MKARWGSRADDAAADSDMHRRGRKRRRVVEEEGRGCLMNGAAAR